MWYSTVSNAQFGGTWLSLERLRLHKTVCRQTLKLGYRNLFCTQEASLCYFCQLPRTSLARVAQLHKCRQMLFGATLVKQKPSVMRKYK